MSTARPFAHLSIDCRLLAEGTGSCQTPLMANSKVDTTSRLDQLVDWCPSPTDGKPHIHVTLANLTYITSLEIRPNLATTLNYRLEYTRDQTVDRYTLWRSYRFLTDQQGKILLDPPMIAKHVRLSIKPMKKSSCLQFELFGCVFTDGVVSYNMLQGAHQLEDDTYDGQYDEKQRYLYGRRTLLLRECASLLVAPYCRWSRAIIRWTDRSGQP